MAEAMFDDLAVLLFAGVSQIVADVKRLAGADVGDFEPETRLVARLGHALRADELCGEPRTLAGLSAGDEPLSQKVAISS